MHSPLEAVQMFAIWALPILFAFTGHAIVMAQMAWRMGDRSPAMRERLSLNPLRHVDPVGTVLVPGLLIVMGGFVIGWPKVVPIDPRAFREPRKALAVISVAALGSNVVMAIVWALVVKVALLQNAEEGVWLGVRLMGFAGVGINAIFLIFGLLPIPGFAGGHIVGALLPPAQAARWYHPQAQMWVMLALLALMVTGILGVLLGPPYHMLQGVVFRIVGLP